MNLYKKFLIQTYNIGIIQKPIGEILNNGIYGGDIRWLKHPYRDRFFADPFIIKENELFYFILVEEYLFWEEKGKITLLKVAKDNFLLIERKVVIEESTHLSFPFCEMNGITVIPESVASGKTIEYTIDTESMSVVSKRVILDEGLIDAVFYTDRNGEKWILTAKSDNPKEDMYIYHYVGQKYVPINNGKAILKSIELSRSAGRLFEHDGKIYRPVQDSTGRYGKQTRIVRLDNLNDLCYEGKCLYVINAKGNPPYDETLHTFNVYNDYTIIDGSKDYFRFPMKIFYKKFRFLFRNK